jgi:PAS domain S-box-containing protein/diguanylate cyclase (GGDEF)-like protein
MRCPENGGAPPHKTPRLADTYSVSQMPELDPNHYRAILESLPNGVYVVDRQYKILFWNDGAEKITGYLRHEVIGQHCADNLLRLHGDGNYQCGANCPLLGTMCDSPVRDALVLLRHKNGERVPVRVRSVPLRDADGSIIGVVESFDEQHPGADQRVHPNAQAVPNHIEQLTGISDHQSILAYLEACLLDFADDRIPFGVLRISIDDLKNFRAIHGAVAADRMVHMVAATLSKNLREGDIAGHWAEDHFIAILLDCPPASLAQMAAMLKVIIEAAAIPWWGDLLRATVSISGATVRPEDAVDSLLLRSEEALASNREPHADDLREK